MQKINYALIGFGGIAENRIAKEGFSCDSSRFSPSEFFQLTGAFDLNPDRKSAVESLGLKWFDNTDAILNDPEIQAVFITTNNLSHAPLATAAMNAGKHVIVEKPLATTPEDAATLMKLAITKHLSLSVDHMMVYNQLNVCAKDFIEANKLGKINDSCFHMEFGYGFDPSEAATWRCSNELELGGPIGDVASHCFYMAEFLFNDFIEEVAAVYYPKLLDIEVEDGAFIRFKMRSGLTGSIRASFSDLRGGLGGTLSNLGYEIYGSEAVLRAFGTMFQLSGYADEPLPIRLEVDFFKNQDKIALADFPSPNIYQGVIDHHAKSILMGTPLCAEEGWRNVRLCYAAHESAQKCGQWIVIK
ncbi:MAG: Gfo/Idh/MocA family oxidoreductase [Planctomycetia bacterium]|nr:Gfo/Idh/MocA family oxidoreductase [Planctomycetia bacterium]